MNTYSQHIIDFIVSICDSIRYIYYIRKKEIDTTVNTIRRDKKNNNRYNNEEKLYAVLFFLSF